LICHVIIIVAVVPPGTRLVCRVYFWDLAKGYTVESGNMPRFRYRKPGITDRMWAIGHFLNPEKRRYLRLLNLGRKRELLYLGNCNVWFCFHLPREQMHGAIPCRSGNLSSFQQGIVRQNYILNPNWH